MCSARGKGCDPARQRTVLYAAPSAGALLVSAASGWIGRVHRHGLAIALAAAAWGLAVAAFGLVGSLWPALALLAMAGAVASAFGVRASVVSGGVLCAIGVVAVTLALPAFRAYDARRGRVPAP
jgi:hypothetical protein